MVRSGRRIAASARCSVQGALKFDGRFNARKGKVKPLRASQSLSATFPCTGYKAFSLKGKALRGNCVARIGI